MPGPKGGRIRGSPLYSLEFFLFSFSPFVSISELKFGSVGLFETSEQREMSPVYLDAYQIPVGMEKSTLGLSTPYKECIDGSVVLVD